MICGLFAAPDEETVSVPLMLVPPLLGGSLVWSTDTRTAVSVAPVAGRTTIHGLLLTASQAIDAPLLVHRTCSARRTQFRVEPGLRQKPMARSLNARDGGPGARAR